MFRKSALITLALWLFCVLGIAAVATDTPQLELCPIPKINPDAPHFYDLTSVPRHQASFQKPAADIQPLESPATLPPPPDYFCEFIDYSGGAAAYYWEIPDPYGDDYFNMRFTPEENYNCTLLAAYIGVYPPAFVGTPDLQVVVWDDDGFGYPLNELGRVTIPFEDLPTSMAYAVVDVSAIYGGEPLVFVDGEEFHVGVTTTDQVNDVLAILSDDGSQGQMRSSESWAGYWGLMLDDWGIDVNFLMGIDICCSKIPYSYCYRQEYDCNVYYYWEQPNPYGTDNYNMKMDPSWHRDTIMAVGVALYEPATVGTPDLDIFIWGDWGGYPDLSNVMFQTTIPHADLQYYPDYNHVDMSSMEITVMDRFHVGWSTNELSDPTGVLAGLSDDGSCGSGRASLCYEYLGCVFHQMVTEYGLDVNFLIYADMCEGEHLCHTESHYCELAYFWRLPDRYGYVGDYQKFPIEPYYSGCRLEVANIALYWPSSEASLPLYTHNSEVQAWTVNSYNGLPDTKISGITLTPADYVMYPGMTTIDFLGENVVYNDAIWLGIESFAPDTLSGIRTLSDDGSCGNSLSCKKYEGGYYYIWDDWGIDVNFVFEIRLCCSQIPPPTCHGGPYGPDEDWVTAAHDFRRTSYSWNSTGNARCKQVLSWMHNDPAGFIYGRPIIYDDIVLAPYNDKLQAFDIDDGTLMWTAGSLPEMGSGFRNSVTCKDGAVYYGGGSGRSFTKADVYTGITIWSRNVLNNPFAGYTTYTTSVILDCNGTEVIFLGTAAGELYALEAATGNNYGGWAINPLMLDGDILHTLSSNETDVLYAGTDGAYGTGNGTVFAIDACSGTIIWSLGEGDLLGPAFSGLVNPGEIFQGPLAVDYDGSIYAITGFNNSAGPPSGAWYKFTNDGSIDWATPGQFPRFSGPVLEDNLVLMTTLRYWTSENENATYGVKKTNGAVYWEVDESYNAMNWVEGAVSCETMWPDRLYVGNMDAQFLCIRTDDGSVEFEYNYVPTADNRGVGVAIDSSHVVMNNRQGDLYVLENQAQDRPRLRILKLDEFETVPFYSPPNFIVTYEDVFMNNGCADLTGTLSADINPPEAFAWTVNPDRIRRMQNAANDMINTTYADMARKLVKRQRIDGSILDAEFAESPYAKESYSNTAAYAPPSWLNAITVPTFSLAPGESFDVVYDVNGPMVSRGPHRCYVTISTNDFEYFLNSDADPAVQLGVLGGCLQSFGGFHFGVGEINHAPVHNTGEIGNQNDEGLWEFDGEDIRYWQGGLFYAADQYRLAWTVDSWYGGDPPDYWNSLLPDPNCYDQCEPYVTPDPIILGRMSHDGGYSYDDVYGYAAVYAYIDSVVNFDCYGGGWDWSNIECPFDNDLTMGLRVEEFMYGAIDEPALANVVIFRHDITNRNADPVEVYLGAFHDYDLDGSLNGFDLFVFDAAHSIAWGSPCSPVYDFTNGVVYGSGKIPMDSDPMIGVHNLDAQQAMWHDEYIALDSMYYWMTNLSGQTAQAGIDMNFPCDPASENDDRDAWMSFVGHTFGDSETYSMGTYMFGYAENDVTDATAFQNLAVLVNQFAGFQRGYINMDNEINLADVIALWNMVKWGGPGPLFEHLADVNADGTIDYGDVHYLGNYCFCVGNPPIGAWVLPNICP